MGSQAGIERATQPGATYDPAQMKIVSDAFERAWMLIEPNHIGTGLGIVDTRTKLAKAVLSVAKQSSAGTPEEMAKKALRAMFSNPIQP